MNIIGDYLCSVGYEAEWERASEEAWDPDSMNPMVNGNIVKNLLLSVAFIISTPALAEVLVDAQRRDSFTAEVSVEISSDPNTHLYTYSYAITSQPSSIQDINVFAFDIDETSPVIEVDAPEGWSSGRYVHRNTYEFASTEGISEANRVQLPNGGYEIRSPHDIEPGETVCCFVFKTFSAPKEGSAYLQGYVPLPQSTGDEEYEPELTESDPSPDDLENNSVKVTTSIPATPLYDGNRRPSVDGFVAPINVYTANKDEFYAPVTLYVAFAINNEDVFMDTFKATLNGVDVTAQFTGDGVGTMTGGNATFDLAEGSPLIVGSNKLILSIEGPVPGTDRIAVDTDQIVFEVLPN